MNPGRLWAQPVANKAMLRAVLDTNIVVASERSEHSTSPNREIITRWLDGGFTLLVSDDILAEYTEKLLFLGKDPVQIKSFLVNLILLSEPVRIVFFHLRHYPIDPDDISFLLCAMNGDATHLVTYDSHLADVGLFYTDFDAVSPTGFLQVLRRDEP